jgi:hypothetical protein
VTDAFDPMSGEPDLRFNPALRCTANSKQAGRRCRRPASPGQSVCYLHGGRSPQAMRKAQERLEKAKLEGEIAQLAAELGEDEAGIVDPIDLLNRSMATSRQMLGLVETLLGEQADLTGPDHLGDLRAHPLAVLLADWAQIAARTANLALRAGIDERRIELAEFLGHQIAEIYRPLIGALTPYLTD